jgi:hypothetical protein
MRYSNHIYHSMLVCSLLQLTTSTTVIWSLQGDVLPRLSLLALNGGIVGLLAAPTNTLPPLPPRESLVVPGRQPEVLVPVCLPDNVMAPCVGLGIGTYYCCASCEHCYFTTCSIQRYNV